MMSLESLDSTHLAVTSYQLYSVFKGQSMSNQSPLETTRFIKVNVIHCWQLHMVTEVPQNSLVSPSHKINYFRFLQYILNLCQGRDSLRPGPSLPQYWLTVHFQPQGIWLSVPSSPSLRGFFHCLWKLKLEDKNHTPRLQRNLSWQ